MPGHGALALSAEQSELVVDYEAYPSDSCAPQPQWCPTKPTQSTTPGSPDTPTSALTRRGGEQGHTSAAMRPPTHRNYSRTLGRS